MASYSFYLAEADAFVRLHPDKSDYLDFNGDVKEDLNCSLFHYDLLIFGCRTIGSLSIISPLGDFQKTDICNRDRCPFLFAKYHIIMIFCKDNEYFG